MLVLCPIGQLTRPGGQTCQDQADRLTTTNLHMEILDQTDPHHTSPIPHFGVNLTAHVSAILKRETKHSNILITVKHSPARSFTYERGAVNCPLKVFLKPI